MKLPPTSAELDERQLRCNTWRVDATATTVLISTLLLVNFIIMAGAVSKMMDKLFASCSGDPKGSVHRAWGLSLLFVLGYFIFSIFESTTRKT
jgi:hypothetical protein